MEFSISKLYQPRKFKLGEIHQALVNLDAQFNLQFSQNQVSVDCSYDGVTKRYNAEFKELALVDEIGTKSFGNFTISYGELRNSNIVIFNAMKNSLQIYVRLANSSITQNYFEAIVKKLELVEIEARPNTIFDEINIRLTELEKTIYSKNESLKCFISSRFNKDTKPIIFEISRFLSLVGVDVVTGLDYEPRSIQDKVLDKINDKIDFILYLVTQDGESMWTRDEIGVAKGHNISIVPLVQEGITFDKGIHGDLEYLSFSKDHISDTYIGILEAINYIKSIKQ